MTTPAKTSLAMTDDDQCGGESDQAANADSIEHRPIAHLYMEP